MVKYFLKLLAILLFLFSYKFSYAQYTRQDTLRGTITPERAWWDVLRYDIYVQPDYNNKTISAVNKIQFKVVKEGSLMQIDLQEPMIIDSFLLTVSSVPGKDKNFLFPNAKTNPVKNGNTWIFDLNAGLAIGSRNTLVIYYHGKPREAINPPWDGGWIWAKDELGWPWMTVACQGLGASVWYPCKDHQSDEPDNGASLTITVPDSLVAVSNGRLKEKKINNNGTTSWQWEVTNPINNYTIVPYIGKYVNWQEKYPGEKGNLDCSYWVLDYDLDKAKKHFGRDVKPMLKCFEDWFGPYPFYEDSYKLVETSHLGMEHQSAVAYGNKFLDGYLGTDLSGTGWGTKWDYIIVHESGHEWFANNITTRDIADMWVHEGFTNYSEVLFAECQSGKKAADKYCQGLRNNIQNDRPIIGDYGVNKEGSSDMYAKGANIIHTIRQVINNDILFKKILRGLNKEFYHKTVDTKDIENYITIQSGKDLSKIFDQYLRTEKIPRLEYKIKGLLFSYRWKNCIGGFNMPVRIVSGADQKWITPKNEWQTQKMAAWFTEKSFFIDKNFYITTRKIND